MTLTGSALEVSLSTTQTVEIWVHLVAPTSLKFVAKSLKIKVSDCSEEQLAPVISQLAI